MPKTIDELEGLLAQNGFLCERKFDVLVATTVATRNYRNPEGKKNLEIMVGFDGPNECVAVEILRAFDLRKTLHKESTLACLMTASASTALLRTSLGPAAEEIRLRVDCTCGADGARDEDVLRAVSLLPHFVDAWYEQIKSAMDKGTFDPSKVAHMNPGCKDTVDTRGTDDVDRLQTFSRKPGAHRNRLEVLFEFRKWLNGQGHNFDNQN